jgi:hypothetical protein
MGTLRDWVSRLCALFVFTMAAGPGLCAVACDLDICPGCAVQERAKACCKEKAKAPKCCDAENSPQIEASHKASANSWTFFPIAVTAPLVALVSEPIPAFCPQVALRDRAPPGAVSEACPCRAPPVRGS